MQRCSNREGSHEPALRAGNKAKENDVELLDVVEATKDLTDLGLAEGSRGTVVEELGADMVLVEFAGTDGMACRIAAVPVESLKSAG